MIMPQYRNKILASGKQVRIVRRFFFEKLGINPNYNSRHLLAALFQLLLFMFANNVSAEEASNQLKIELPDSVVASADTLLRRLKETNERFIQKAFNNTVKRIVKSLAKKRYIMAIDYHDIPYYGDINNPHVRGTKRQRGTNYCHQYATLEIVDGKQRLTIAVKKLSLDDDSKALVVEELVRIAKKHAEIRIVLLDRAFYGAECIKTLKLQRVKFVIAVPKDKAIKRAIAENSFKLPIVVQHCVGKKETFNLCMIYSKKKEPKKQLQTPTACETTVIDVKFLKTILLGCLLKNHGAERSCFQAGDKTNGCCFPKTPNALSKEIKDNSSALKALPCYLCHGSSHGNCLVPRQYRESDSAILS